MIRFYRKYCPYLATTLLVAVILYLTLAPQPLPENDIPIFPGADKIVHAIMFMVLALVGMFDASLRRPLTLRLAWLIAGAAALFGALIEFLQWGMALGRSFELADILADTLGALLAIPLRRFLPGSNS